MIENNHFRIMGRSIKLTPFILLPTGWGEPKPIEAEGK